MGILTIVIDSRGAAIPYLEIMEQLWDEGVEVLTYVSDDLRSYVETQSAPAIIDRFNFSIFSTGSALYESAENALTLLLAGRQITNVWVPSAMKTIAAAAQEGRFNPAETVVVSSSGGLLLLGHFLLQLGIKHFISLDPYRLLDWHNIWQKDSSQMAPGMLSKQLSIQLFRLLLSSQGKQKAVEFFDQDIVYDYSAIKAAIKKQLYMYSPQLVEDKHLAYGYPYPATEWTISSELTTFIDNQRQQGKQIIVFTMGSMDVSQQRRNFLIQQFADGIRAHGNAAGIILGADSPNDELNFATREFVPYSTLFPQVDIVVMHGGAGTTHLALYSGKPVLNIPFLKDQYDWADRLKKLGMQVGVIPQKQFTAERFASVIQQNYSEDVVSAARHAGEIERRTHNNSRALLDELITGVEEMRLYGNRVR